MNIMYLFEGPRRTIVLLQTCYYVPFRGLMLLFDDKAQSDRYFGGVRGTFLKISKVKVVKHPMDIHNVTSKNLFNVLTICTVHISTSED